MFDWLFPRTDYSKFTKRSKMATFADTESNHSVSVSKDGSTTLTLSYSGGQTKLSMDKQGWERLIRMIRATYEDTTDDSKT